VSKLDGHCMCGAVSYTSEAEPVFVGVCHCKDCQRQTGAAHSVVVGVPGDQVQITGEDSLKTWVTVGEDHGTDVQRHFCGTCGSPIYTENTVVPGVFIMKAGTLDDTSWLQPQIEIWGKSAQPWVEQHETRPRVPRGVAG